VVYKTLNRDIEIHMVELTHGDHNNGKLILLLTFVIILIIYLSIVGYFDFTYEAIKDITHW
jgi:hypothetical protein